MAVDQYLGEALGQMYVAEVFPPESKARAQKIVMDIEAAMDHDIDSDVDAAWDQARSPAEASGDDGQDWLSRQVD
jgi:predicted metalloendopeptidase